MRTSEYDKWEEWSSDDAVADTRAQVIDFARQSLADTGALARRDPVMVVRLAQYWADTADDEVHLGVFASAREPVLGHHRCGDHALEQCDRCGRWPRRMLSLHAELVPAFEAFCREGGDQNQIDDQNYRPWAIVRPNDERIVGELVRPWLDLAKTAPPPVAADARLLALASFARDDPHALDVFADELEHRGLPRELPPRAWLGALAPHVPRSALRVIGGVPDEIGIYLDDGQELPDDPLPFAFRPRVRFLPRSRVVIAPALATARALEALGAVALEDIALGDLAFRCEELEVHLLDGPEQTEALRMAVEQMPRLRSIRLVGPTSSIAGLAGWDRLGLITEIACGETPAEQAAAAAAWHAAGVRATVAMFDRESERAAGWAIGPDRAIEHLGYHPNADDAWLASLRAAVAR